MNAAKPGIFPAETPDDNGALGRNKAEGKYSSVRWQLDLGHLMLTGLLDKNTGTLDQSLRAVEYGFQRQESNGGFSFSPIAGVSQTPTETDLASGSAFFLASVGIALAASRESAFFQSGSDCASLRQRLAALSGGLTRALDYLKSKENLLVAGDEDAPNRLLFDTVAAHGLALFLSNESGLALARRFAEKALDLQNKNEGWFREGSGWDSSYQAVGSVNLFYYGTMLGAGEFRDRVFARFYAAAAWECGRVLPSGEVSTFGNSRVFPGGEKFLGSEKNMAALSVAQCLYAAGAVFGDTRFNQRAAAVVKFYFRR